MQITVPVMACTQVQLGWQAGNGKIEPRMCSSCTFTGRYRDENILFTPILVPEVYSASLKAGSWHRFKRFDARSVANLADIKPAQKKGKTSIFFGAPVLVEAKLEGFTKNEKKMQMWDRGLTPLTR